MGNEDWKIYNQTDQFLTIECYDECRNIIEYLGDNFIHVIEMSFDIYSKRFEIIVFDENFYFSDIFNVYAFLIGIKNTHRYLKKQKKIDAGLMEFD